MKMEFSGYYQHWWFGINNSKERRHSMHMVYSEIIQFFEGYQVTLNWPSPRRHQPVYDDLLKDDKVLFWMGDGDYPNWGIIGFGYIDNIKNIHGKHSNTYILRKSYIPSQPITPYPRKEKYPQKTKETYFLEDVFGLGFLPLKTTFRVTKFIDEDDKARPITVMDISKDQFERCLQMTKKLSGDT